MSVPEIRTSQEKKLVGKRLTTSLTHNQTRMLWQGFMPMRKEIAHVVGTDLYSLQVYPTGYFNPFNPDGVFEKWAAAEVENFDIVPHDMETMILPSGLYAVFLYKGAASAATPTYQYIFTTWLPGSDYALDTRPHFEILGAKYKNEDPESEEEIWIPIRPKKPA